MGYFCKKNCHQEVQKSPKLVTLLVSLKSLLSLSCALVNSAQSFLPSKCQILALSKRLPLRKLLDTYFVKNNFRSRCFVASKSSCHSYKNRCKSEEQKNDFCVAESVTRLGNLLDLGQLFKAFGNN